jgi:hypothetical protein
MVKRMHRNRYPRRSGSTMALYATFLALVGIPLLALNIDVARVYVGKARLRSATQAACQAYSTMLDYKNFQTSDTWGFESNAMSEANRVFLSIYSVGWKHQYKYHRKGCWCRGPYLYCAMQRTVDCLGITLGGKVIL